MIYSLLSYISFPYDDSNFIFYCVGHAVFSFAVILLISHNNRVYPFSLTVKENPEYEKIEAVKKQIEESPDHTKLMLAELMNNGVTGCFKFGDTVCRFKDEEAKGFAIVNSKYLFEYENVLDDESLKDTMTIDQILVDDVFIYKYSRTLHEDDEDAAQLLSLLREKGVDIPSDNKSID